MRGHLRKRGSKWCFVIDIGRDPITGKRKQKWFSGYNTKKEAEKALAEKLQKLNTGFFVDSNNLTVKDYLHKWLKDYAEHSVAPKTFRSYKDTVELHLIPKLGDIKLQKLNPATIQSLYTWYMENTNLSSTSIRYNHKILNMALKQAVRWQLIPRNPCEAVTPPKRKKHNVEVLTAEQVELLLNECRGNPVFLPVLLAVSTGMRRGEISALKWDDIDFEKKMIYVKNSMQRIDGELKLVPTKTDKSRRSILLLDSIIPVLKRYKAIQKENKFKLGKEYHDNNFVCTWPDGRPISPDYITNAFSKLRDKLEKEGKIPHVRFHDLRHTHATLLLKEGVHPKIVSERLGHSQISITMDIYSHVVPQMQKEAAEKLDKKLFANNKKHSI